MSQQALKPEYFVTRNNGVMVPLVAVDELPHHIVIEGVSRVMSPFDIAGMTCVGRSNLRHRHHTIKNVPETRPNTILLEVDSLRAKYFITRESGNLVALVAMDEMPENFVVDGVERCLSVFDITGMTCVGTADTRDNVHTVEDVNKKSLSLLAENLSTAQSSIVTTPVPSVTEEQLPAGQIPSPCTSPYENIDLLTPEETDSDRQSISTSFKKAPDVSLGSDSARETVQSMQTGGEVENMAQPARIGSFIPGIKEYCSYWLRHGECDYQQQGCLYKHEMPLDKRTLQRLGLRDIPRWYREKHALGSYLATGGSGAAFSGEGMKSTAATRGGEKDEPNKFMRNWRTGSSKEYRPEYTARHTRSNIYDPRKDRTGAGPASFTQRPLAESPAPLRYGKLRSNETLQHRQNLETIQNLEAHAKSYRDRQKQFGLLTARVDDTESVDTFISDIETPIMIEATERKAKEEAACAKALEMQKISAAKDVASSLAIEKKAKKPNHRKSQGGRQRGRTGSGRSQSKKPDNKPKKAV